MTLKMADDLWAWVTEYPDGTVGLIAATNIIDGYIMPLIGRSEEIIRKQETSAVQHGKRFGQRVWLRHYTKAKDEPDVHS